MTAQDYITSIWQQLSISDICSGLGKTVFFGLEIAAIGCYNGLQVEGGAASVGRATTRTVVLASICDPDLGLLPDQALPGHLMSANPSAPIGPDAARPRPRARRSSSSRSVWKSYSGRDVLAGRRT